MPSSTRQPSTFAGNDLFHAHRRLLLSLLALICQVSGAAHAQQYAPVSSEIPIPGGYTEMLVPAHQGRLLQTGTYAQRYPSAAHNMQLMAFRNPATAQVLYVQTKDPDGQVIDWAVTGGNGNYTLKLTVYTSTGTFPDDFYLTDTLSAADHSEFYRRVAHRYKLWAVHQKWAKRKRSRMDTMATMAVAPDLRRTTVTEKIAPYIDAWSGQDTGCWVTYWRGWWPGFHIDTAVPDYRLANRQESLSSLAALNAKNCAPFPYMNALLWDSDIVYTQGAVAGTPQHFMNEIWTNNPAARYSPAPMVKDIQGAVVGYAPDSSRKFVCQSSSTWKSTFLNACRAVAADGWKGIYYDQAAFVAPKLCYDATHAHAPGDPRAWQNGIRDLLTELRTDSRTRDLIVFTEGNAEIYMDLVDAFLPYAETASIDSEAPLRKQVPLFREVYGDIARFFGWQVFPESEPIKTAADLTPEIFRDAMKKSANFGSLFPSPYFSGWDPGGDDDEVQAAIATDSRYAGLFDLLNNPQYKRVYERGAGTVNWVKSGAAPDPVSVVDEETRSVAVRFATANPGDDEYHELRIDDWAMFQLSWDMKMSGPYYMLVTVADATGGVHQLRYDEHDLNYRQTTGATSHIGLGADTASGQWRTVRRDLADDLYQGTSQLLSRVIGFRVHGSGLVDNVSLSAEPYVLEDGNNAARWVASAAGLSASSIMDADSGSAVVQFDGIDSRDDGQYFRRSINDSQRFELAWDLKTRMSYYVIVDVTADDGVRYSLVYDPGARSFRQTVGSTVRLGVGADTANGQWHSVRRNLADDLFEGAGKSIARVVEMRVFATGALDNVALWGNGLRTSGR